MIKGFVKVLIEIYQWFSRFTPRRCRFYPTCSQYTIEAIDAFGPAKGLLLGIKRIIKCHPFSKGGYDPVKGKK